MSGLDDLVGQVVVAVSEFNGGADVRLADGRVVRFSALAYDDADLEVETLDRVALNREARERQGGRERKRVAGLAYAARCAAERALRSRVRAAVSLEAYEAWVRDRGPTGPLSRNVLALRRVFIDPVL